MMRLVVFRFVLVVGSAMSGLCFSASTGSAQDSVWGPSPSPAPAQSWPAAPGGQSYFEVPVVHTTPSAPPSLVGPQESVELIPMPGPSSGAQPDFSIQPVDPSLNPYGGTPDPPLDPRTLDKMTEWGGPDPLSIESPFFYRAKESAWRFLALGQNSFGDSSWESTPHLDLERHAGLATGFGVSFLDGPMTPNLHPRLFNFSAAYQHRASLLNGWSFDIAAGVGAFSDFEGSAAEGIRFPGHAVLSGPMGQRARWVAGIDYMDRDDFAMLPVAGIRYEPFPDLQIHAEFPRPMIRWLRDQSSHYLRAELGGGTWAIEPTGLGDDVMTYREIGVYLGSDTRTAGSNHAVEIGYVSGRRIDYRSGFPSQDLPDGWVFRIVDRF